MLDSNKKVYNNATIFDCCLESNDYEMLSFIFSFIEHIDERLNDILSNIICKSAISGKMQILYILSKMLILPKFKKVKISINSLCDNSELTLNTFNFIKRNFKCIDLSTINLNNAIKFCRPMIFKEMIMLKSPLSEENVKSMEKLGENRQDNLLILVECYPNYIRFEHDKYIESLKAIEGLLDEREYLIEKEKQRKLKIILKRLNIGLAQFTKEKIFLPHLIFKTSSFWALKSLPDYFANYFFIKDDNQNYPFDYIIPTQSFFIKDLKLILDYFDSLIIDNNKKANYILLFLEKIFNFFNQIPEIEGFNFDIIEILNNYKYIYDYSNDDDENIFFILSKISGKNFETIFNDHSKRININQQNKEGDTFLMNLIKNKKYDIAKKIIDKYDINFEICNNDGNSYLHLLFKDNDLEKLYDNELKLFFELTSKIITKKPSFILHQNREGLTPYILAARAGCNSALFLMSLFYPPEIIEKFSSNTSALNDACYFNKIKTVKFLIEYLNYDANKQIIQKENSSSKKLFNNYSTPLHCAAKSSSLEIFKVLLKYGANPFITDSEKKDSISIALEHSDKNFLEYLFNSPFIIRNNYNNSHLIHMVKNLNAEKFIISYINDNSIYRLGNIIDENMNNLLMLSCIKNNPNITNLFINSDIEILAKNELGNNVLHLCCYSNSLSCASEILSKISDDEINKLLCSQNKNGDTPLHIASEEGLFSFVTLFLSYTYTNNKIFTKNNNNLSPIQQSIKYNNFDITLLFMKFYKLDIKDLENMLISDISFEFNNFINYYKKENSEKKKIEKKYNMIIENKTKLIEEKLYNDNISNENSTQNTSVEEILNHKSFEGFYKILSEKYKPQKFTEEFFIKFQPLIGNFYTLLTFIRWCQDEKPFLIDKFIDIVLNANDNKNSLEICEMFLNYILIKINSSYAENVLNEMNNLVLFCNSHKNTYYFVQIIHSIIISSIESKKKLLLVDLLTLIKKFRELVQSDPINILEYLKSIKFNIFAYQYIDNLVKICEKKENMKLIQIKYAKYIPPLLNIEINELIQKYPIIHESIYSLLPIDGFIKTVLSDETISPELLDMALKCDIYIKNSMKLNINEKIAIFENMIKIIKSSSICEELFSLVKAAETYIIKSKDIKSFGKIIEKNKNLKEIILNLNKLNELPEFNFDDYEDKLDSLLSRIEYEDKSTLKELAKYFNKYYNYYNVNKNFNELGRQLGLEFKNNPSIENMSKLLAIISRGFEESMNYTPYLIQILAVSTFLTHYIRNNNRGRIAQIKTGEGKSMIIAILALSNALMGYFVDVITSTHYLAERDQIKFSKLFLLFGVSSSNIIKENPIKEDYNGIILYGTNTDFEFTLLKEGLFIQNKNMTVPLGKNQYISREYHVSIVDECDNLFLDTALNSARISYSCKYHYNWVYAPIFDNVKNNPSPNIEEIRDLLNKFENGFHKNELLQISDERIKNWVNAAKMAMKKTINKDYIIGFNEKLQKKEIQIISSDTGRVQHGTRWSGGIHEFVEIKEGLIPEEETSVIGSISHPTYFQNYQTIFGLTGTIGEDIEKEEISKIYNVELYCLPRNFKEKLIIEKAEVLNNKEDKYQRIINIILENTLKQPMLIILESIQESLIFSEKLKSLGINNMVLNDAQKEKEEYILEKAGDIGSILVSTNAAGRGTDIILSKNALEVGGLYVILGFFPQNSRIEYQGIGRAGRQGQPGRAKIVFSKDEFFVQLITLMGILLSCKSDDEVMFYYNARNIYIKQESDKRVMYTEKEKVYFNLLNKYFYFKRFILELFENPKIKNIIESNFDYYNKFLMNNIDQLWANYFSEKVTERNTNNILNNNLFVEFLEYFLKEIQIIIFNDPLFSANQNDFFINIITELKNNLKLNIMNNDDYSVFTNYLKKYKEELWNEL